MHKNEHLPIGRGQKKSLLIFIASGEVPITTHLLQQNAPRVDERMFVNDRAPWTMGVQLLEVMSGIALLSMTVCEDMLNGQRT
ncbi:hypothetical protein [Polaromonas sp. CG_9.11]|uniref:hypothetical protein n=1 Tax=Polaromonas sp. CG_9.11 TaxID=2787730 RepID=UPI0018CB1D9A|nr:hypothetical protein [Polaromonas sp. CG_9.11]MBG6075694.1 hypothetical protein [Polaromonas sp. CG_9.11]